MDRESGRAYVDHEAEIVKSRDEAFGELGLVAAVEMVRAEVAVNRHRREACGRRP